MMHRKLAAAILGAASLAGCGSVTDSVDFHVPPSYVSRASLGPFMQVWESPDKKSVMMLMQIPASVDLNKAMQNMDIKDATIKKREQLTICGNQPAIFGEVVGATGSRINVGIGNNRARSENSNVDFMITRVNGKSYVASYVWPLHGAPDPTAQASLHGICAKK